MGNGKRIYIFVRREIIISIFISFNTIIAGDLVSTNIIPNGDFKEGKVGMMPDGWSLVAARPVLAPIFKLVEKEEQRFLLATGNGSDDCAGFVHTQVPIQLGKTYLFQVKFQISKDLNPHKNLLFQCFHFGTKNGIFTFHKQDDGWINGAVKIFYPGEGKADADVRILFRLNAYGKAWIKDISLYETTPIEPRWVRTACTQGRTNLENCREILDIVGQSGVDLVLLPESMAGSDFIESLYGPSYVLMSEKAQKYGMYVAGGILRRDEYVDRVFNTAILIDREGNLVGTYDKIHPYSPEVNERGITPGRFVPIFETDFGKVGFIICYDSWFTDVIELLALKGAKMVLFPSAGYYRSLMPARAADNNVRIIASTWNTNYGVWDTVGRDVLNPDADSSLKPVRGTTFKDVEEKIAGQIKILFTSLDLNSNPSPSYNGGTMFSAPGSRRNRRDQSLYLEDAIKYERERWWEEKISEN